MSERARCPDCGAELPIGATAGICPKCLLAGAMESSQAPGDVNSPFAPATPQPGAFVPPGVESLVACFPQLEIVGLLGHGGMGAVYKARQTKLDRFVALKIIRPESADDPAFAERFTREARTLARLSHPNIVAVHDFGELPGGLPAGSAAGRTLFYFAMEYVDGANLRELMQSGGLRPEQALAIVPQICDALQYAHDEGVVHRDIKPENILIDRRGRVKIADFGLAKLAAQAPENFTLTATHQVMGTPRYMAPEQMAGSRTVDHRADIYSLGVVFYEMLTGELPLGSFEPPSRKGTIDPRLDEIVHRALATDPGRRYQHASELRRDIDSIVLEQYSAISQAGGETYDAPVAFPGPSTIIERQVAGVVNWLRGPESDSGRRLGPALTQPDRERIQRQVRAPAIALLTFGGLGLIFATLMFITGILNASFGMIVGGGAVFIWSGLVLQGGWHMLSLEHLPVALFAATIGQPLGIWALIVLSRSEVKAAFAPDSDGPVDDAPKRPKRRPSPWRRRAGIVVLVLAISAAALGLGQTVISIVRAFDPVGDSVASPQELSSAISSALRGTMIALVCAGGLFVIALALLSRSKGRVAAGDRRGRSLGRAPAGGPHDDAIALPRFSRKAIVGACWAALFFVALAAVVPSWVVVQPDRESVRRVEVRNELREIGRALHSNGEISENPVSDSAGHPESLARSHGPGQLFLLPLLLVGIPVGLAPFGTTILGLVAISDIRHSRGRLIGLPLAFADAVLFPILLLDLGILGVSQFIWIEQSESAIVAGLIITLLLAAGVDFLLLRAGWRAVLSPVGNGGVNEAAGLESELRTSRTDRALLQSEGRSLGTPETGSVVPSADKAAAIAAGTEPASMSAAFPDLDLRRIQMELKGPAGGLLIVALLSTVFWCIQGTLFWDRWSGGGRHRLSPDEVVSLVGGAVILLLAAGVLICAARHMRRMTGYEWCVGASILAMLPWSPVMLVGVPVGIWAFRLLRRQDVRDAFLAKAVEREQAARLSVRRGGRDWVTLTREQVEDDDLPDVCIVCGAPTRERVSRNFEHTPDWAAFLCVFGLFPGLVAIAMTQKSMRMACPVCPADRGHWSRLVWVSSVGWLVIVPLSALAYLLVATFGGDGMAPAVGALIGGLVGLVLWLVPVIYLSSTRVSAKSITDDRITLQRVAPAFARAATAARRQSGTSREPSGLSIP